MTLFTFAGLHSPSPKYLRLEDKRMAPSNLLQELATDVEQDWAPSHAGYLTMASEL
jgi:hypothetical protein